MLTVKSNVMRLSFLCTGLIGLAMVSTAIPWFAVLLALGFGFHLYQAKPQKQKVPLLVSACATGLLVLLLAGHLFFALHLAWLLIPILLLSSSDFLIDNTLQVAPSLKPQTEPEVYVENSPLASFPDKQQLRQKYNELINEDSFRDQPHNSRSTHSLLRLVLLLFALNHSVPDIGQRYTEFALAVNGSTPKRKARKLFAVL